MRKKSRKDSINKYILHPENVLLRWLCGHPLWFGDKTYLKLKYRFFTGKKLDLKSPTTFSEKLQWLKLNHRNKLFTQMVDKVQAKKYVANIIGEKYIIPTIRIWNNVEDINWESLPSKFVIKCNHDSGGLVICSDKDNLDIEEAKRKLRYGLDHDNYSLTREWPYKNVDRKLICEEFICSEGETDLIDYKFFCFNGVPVYCQVISNRHTSMCIDFFDKDWNHQPFREPAEYPGANQIPIKPQNYDEMLDIAAKLSQNLPFLRVDLYNINGRIYFGELTFFPTSGFAKFNPEDWNLKFGEMITLPVKK